MTSRQSPGKVTLGMMKGKPITTSVPVIKYHASDDELEELYPSTDDERATDSKDNSKKEDDAEGNEGCLEKRSASIDEGTPSDPWKVLSGIRGKITKTFEDKLLEIKSERKRQKHKRRTSRENSSVSDYEEIGDLTPTEESLSERNPIGEDSTTIVQSKEQAGTRFVEFSRVKTGLKIKGHEEDDTIESGVEAAEINDDVFAEDCDKSKIVKDKDNTAQIQGILKHLPIAVVKFSNYNSNERKYVLKYIGSRLKDQLIDQLIYQLFILSIIVACSYYSHYVMPSARYLVGFSVGVLITLFLQNVISRVKKILTTMPEPLEELEDKPLMPVEEIPPVEEQSVLERFEGWLNELPYNYDSDNYHVARTNPVFFKLEGDTLRVMETKSRIPKRGIWDEPLHKAKFTRKRVYSMPGATLKLLPEGLIRRRRWSKKYPIYIVFAKDALQENSVLDNSLDDDWTQTDGDPDKSLIEEEETDDDISLSRDPKDIFVDCRDDEDGTALRMFIFARTDRQKEDWYRRLEAATNFKEERATPSPTKSSATPTLATPLNVNNDFKNSSSAISDITPELSYNSYMLRYLQECFTPTSDSTSSLESNDLAWLNALFGRILFDMHKCPDMISALQDRMQRKLSNIKLPHFMESLTVSELVIGQGAPMIHKATKPIIDERGLWLDLDISYEACLTMTIETKLNLMKLTKGSSSAGNGSDLFETSKPKPTRSPIFDSDVEDSPETSTEDDDSASFLPPNTSRESTPTQSSGRKFLSMVDKLAANKYFQHATELSYVRRAMEGFSNTEIRLMVSVSSIEGCLAINIPPPPADRLWYGFKPVPKISLNAKPALGERAVNIVYVTNWIEAKLLREFEKIVVLPNMDDIILPLCPNYPYISK